jgi:hypothetical protein
VITELVSGFFITLHLPDPARHRTPSRGSGKSAYRLRRDHRRPAQPDLRQPQGGADAPPATDHLRDLRDHHRLAASPFAAVHPTGHRSLAVPEPAATSTPVARAPDVRLCGEGIQGVGSPDRHHRRRAARTRRLPGTVRAVRGDPYALRHSAAQRHADAAVPVDDGLYRVGLKRKQQTIGLVGSGHQRPRQPAPFTSSTAYERASVFVPFGNCTEPSNVKAGGGACPIRFQCAGCGFYRPDPPSCRPLSSTSPTCAPIGKPPGRSGPPTTCWPTSPPRSTLSPR